MKRVLSVVLTALIAVGCSNKVDTIDYAKWVNPLIGTEGPGNVYPGATVPFGMVQLSPDNGMSGWYRISGYSYSDTTIAGFSHTHLSGTGAGDLYDIIYMPAVPPFKIGKGELGIYSTFSHERERAEAGYYQVWLQDYNVNVELTATERCGMQRYTFPATDNATVFVNLSKAMNWDYTMGSDIRIVDSTTIEGYRLSEGWATDQRIYFVSKFSRPFERHKIDTIVSRHRDPKYNGIRSHVASFIFDSYDGEEVVVKTAISGVSIEGAYKNLAAELPAWNFDSVRTAAKERWNKELSVVEVNCGTDDEKTNFYTALYRTMIAPTIFSDVDGSYLGPDKQVHKTENWTNYSTFSLWDTYRTAHPLFTFTQRERVGDMVRSMVAFYEQHGALPVWNMWANETDMMIGYHAVPIIAEAYLKGIGGFDPEKALAACVASADQDSYRGIGKYKKIGYVPLDDNIESVSKTLEYAYDDYCIAMMARKMGKNDIYDRFIKRSKSYVNIFNPSSGFFEPKYANGKWLGGFDPKLYTEHITESNGWQYRFAVQQDIESLITLLGGKVNFEKALDDMFTLNPTSADSLPIFSTGMIGQYAHGNEPSHHVAYLYNWTEAPQKAQQYVSEIMRTQYSNTPDGLCGNEDCGQMSAWYVMSAMGFYPVDPVSLSYALGTPLFERIVLNLPDGKIFEIEAKGVSAKNYYIESWKLNGETLSAPFITWDQINAGGKLEFIVKQE